VAEGLVEDLQDAANIEDPAERAAVRHNARAQAITFLKNHDFRGAVDESAHLEELKKQLDSQRKRGAGGLKALTEAAAAFEATLGGKLQ
jgi:hypothetical protein